MNHLVLQLSVLRPPYLIKYSDTTWIMQMCEVVLVNWRTVKNLQVGQDQTNRVPAFMQSNFESKQNLHQNFHFLSHTLSFSLSLKHTHSFSLSHTHSLSLLLFHQNNSFN